MERAAWEKARRRRRRRRRFHGDQDHLLGAILDSKKEGFTLFEVAL